MPVDLSKFLVIGISSRALFDLSEENRIYEEHGLEAYCKYQLEHEDDILKPGTGFPLVDAILRLNALVPNKRKSEVIVMSRNSADTSLRIFNSIAHYKLDITRAALTGGASLAPYLQSFNVDLFLSASEEDVQRGIDAGTAAGLIYPSPNDPTSSIDQIRIAFDGDAVLFSDDSERIYQEQGIEAFLEHERINAKKPLPEGPFAKLLKSLSYLQFEAELGNPPIRTALVTARNSPAHERVIRTLRAWGVRIDEAFFMGGVPKDEILKAFGAHISLMTNKPTVTPHQKLYRLQECLISKGGIRKSLRIGLERINQMVSPNATKKHFAEARATNIEVFECLGARLVLRCLLNQSATA